MTWLGGVSEPFSAGPFDTWTVEGFEADGGVWVPEKRKWRTPDGRLINGPGSDGSEWP